MNKCWATKNNGKTCFANTKPPLKFCHIHDPDGTFRQQLKSKGIGKKYVPKCDHKWYMREKGIECKKCFLIWKPEMDANL